MQDQAQNIKNANMSTITKFQHPQEAVDHYLQRIARFQDAAAVIQNVPKFLQESEALFKDLGVDQVSCKPTIKCILEDLAKFFVSVSENSKKFPEDPVVADKSALLSCPVEAAVNFGSFTIKNVTEKEILTLHLEKCIRNVNSKLEILQDKKKEVEDQLQKITKRTERMDEMIGVDSCQTLRYTSEYLTERKARLTLNDTRIIKTFQEDDKTVKSLLEKYYALNQSRALMMAKFNLISENGIFPPDLGQALAKLMEKKAQFEAINEEIINMQSINQSAASNDSVFH